VQSQYGLLKRSLQNENLQRESERSKDNDVKNAIIHYNLDPSQPRQTENPKEDPT
jgi:hypothetical protein